MTWTNAAKHLGESEAFESYQEAKRKWLEEIPLERRMRRMARILLANILVAAALELTKRNGASLSVTARQ